ncbi:DUF3226 domain-containing protein [Paenibacillus guangzhouensis]|uniref:DUF3226 domain-containing protein n=1 Tax=Paenibacillus guangzhouensis TaxID=1473112 RepID=UPI00126782DA|nr:DUF3226 domain-containing protein [Paenibacillus guangzhouensis]
MKVVLILCEGPHDVAFIYRVLRTMNFRNYGEKIGKAPYPLNAIFKNAIEKHDLNQLNLQNYYPLLPMDILYKDKIIVLLYSVGGNTKHDRVRDLIGKYLDILEVPATDTEITNISFVFTNDADDKGIESVVNIFKEEYSKTLPLIKEISNLDIICNEEKNNKELFLGCYIFEKGDGMGKLEDVVLPLMIKDHEPLFTDIETFLQKNSSYIPKKHSSDTQKMSIGIAGQLKKPGKTNKVIISDTDYISDQKIQQDPKIIELICYFEKLFSTLVKEAVM